MSFNEHQIIATIREIADRAFDGIGIPYDRRIEIEQHPSNLKNEAFVGSTKSVVGRSNCAWCEYRIDIGNERWLDVRVITWDLGGDELQPEIEGLAPRMHNDFAEFCEELKKKLEARAPKITR